MMSCRGHLLNIYLPLLVEKKPIGVNPRVLRLEMVAMTVQNAFYVVPFLEPSVFAK